MLLRAYWFLSSVVQTGSSCLSLVFPTWLKICTLPGQLEEALPPDHRGHRDPWAICQIQVNQLQHSFPSHTRIAKSSETILVSYKPPAQCRVPSTAYIGWLLNGKKNNITLKQTEHTTQLACFSQTSCRLYGLRMIDCDMEKMKQSNLTRRALK